MAGKVVVLGGGGGVGSVAARALAHTDDADEVVVVDLSAEAAAATVAEIADPRFRAEGVDITDDAAFRALVEGADVVLNCVGPFYRFGAPTLQKCIDAGVTYVDVCDDLSATRAQLELDGAAKAAGVQALIGMGNSPGLANIFVKMCAEMFLDEVHSADIMHIHGGEPDEGAAVIKHRVWAMVNDVPLFVDGEFVSVRMLEDDAEPYISDQDFIGVEGTYPVFPYPHPEVITLPPVFPTLKRATNLGVIFPLPYFTMTQDLVAAGMGSEEPLTVGDAQVAPIDVMVALLQRERPRLLAEAGVTGPGGALKVVVGGIKDGAEHTYICTVTSEGAGAGEGTGIPAALGAILALRGGLEGGPGVHAPESIVDVTALMELAGTVVSSMGVGDGSGVPLTLEHLGPDGSHEVVPFGIGSN